MKHTTVRLDDADREKLRAIKDKTNQTTTDLLRKQIAKEYRKLT